LGGYGAKQMTTIICPLGYPQYCGWACQHHCPFLRRHEPVTENHFPFISPRAESSSQKIIKCSNCGILFLPQMGWKYCPFCGVKIECGEGSS